MKVVVAGGRGFIGQGLLPRLAAQGHELRVLSRSDEPLPGSDVPVTAWQEDPAAVLDGAQAVINLCGSPLFLPKSRSESLDSSRVDVTRFLLQCMQAVPQAPEIWINASASWIYGMTGEEWVDENHEPGKTKLAQLCVDWEQAAAEAKYLGTRVVKLRMGLVLGQGSGALAQLTPIFKFYSDELSGPGRRSLSWIHLDDLLEIILFSLKQGTVWGPVNATSPDPRTLHDFGRILGKVMGPRSWDFVPAQPVSSLLGDTPDIVLQGARVVPAKLRDLGYEFRRPTLQEALGAIYDAVPSF